LSRERKEEHAQVEGSSDDPEEGFFLGDMFMIHRVEWDG
jgi:hypothetical protein